MPKVTLGPSRHGPKAFITLSYFTPAVVTSAHVKPCFSHFSNPDMETENIPEQSGRGPTRRLGLCLVHLQGPNAFGSKCESSHVPAYRSSLDFTVSHVLLELYRNRPEAPRCRHHRQSAGRENSIYEVCLFTLHIQGSSSLTLPDDR